MSIQIIMQHVSKSSFLTSDEWDISRVFNKYLNATMFIMRHVAHFD